MVVDEAHRRGLPVTAHAHARSAVVAALDAGVDGIEHGSCVTATGFGLDDALVARLATAGLAVCPTLGQTELVEPPAAILELLAALGTDPAHLLDTMRRQAARMLQSGVRVLAGTDAGVGSAKPHGIVALAVADLVRAGVPTARRRGRGHRRRRRGARTRGATGSDRPRVPGRPAGGGRRPGGRRRRAARRAGGLPGWPAGRPADLE